ncbi:adenylate/guanylate cyclase domain-containing protein [Methylobacillus glycogenes]|uniref:adenylate/guanylate cyclase domain-containing protein n=1 Tax=Methylobacillus glycogenes TaxID=406 RepID=UPI000684C3D4|nr:adenylate/guanylate cyclase domain-containing protein [Methylobacillus glycogenes]
MLQALQEVNTAFYQKGWPRLEIGIGLNSGEMTVGNMGSAFRMAYTVLGDAVNLGARLESLSPYYAEPLILSEAVCLAATQYHYRELDLVRVKGKDAAVRIYAPILDSAAQIVTSSEAEQQSLHYAQALLHYREQHWQQARTAFLDLQSRFGERRIHHIYLARIAECMSQPPEPQWQGIHRFDSKQGPA